MMEASPPLTQQSIQSLPNENGLQIENIQQKWYVFLATKASCRFTNDIYKSAYVWHGKWT
jgi:hypothetical protein